MNNLLTHTQRLSALRHQREAGPLSMIGGFGRPGAAAEKEKINRAVVTAIVGCMTRDKLRQMRQMRQLRRFRHILFLFSASKW